ncbi:MAG TPA: GNAT family N-acetyltransferase [Dehalococcoidia bacterium]|nr:GNAT family N-acetyltransferase [Dehalococcoidia bacterium]
MIIRQATHADNAALCALEARTPLNMDGEPFYIRPTNFFEKHDLQERSVVMVAEEAGEIIGACAGALHRAPLAGKERLLLYMNHERIAPEHQRKGIGGALTRAVAEYWKAHESEHIDSSYWYIAAGNRQSRNFAERSGNRPWPVSARMCILPPPAETPPAPRQIGAGPIFDIVRLVNGTHLGKELFRAYEQVDFGQRLARSPSYGWGDIYGAFRDGRLVAVCGLWDGAAADYGYEPGAEPEMALLLRALAVKAASTGHGGLMFCLEPDSRLWRELGLRDEDSFELLFYAPRVEPPAHSTTLYVDPVYF